MLAGAQKRGGPALQGWGGRGLGQEAGRRRTGEQPGPLQMAHWGPGCEAPPETEKKGGYHWRGQRQAVLPEQDGGPGCGTDTWWSGWRWTVGWAQAGGGRWGTGEEVSGKGTVWGPAAGRSVTWAPRDGWSVSALGYVLKGRPAATFTPLARPGGWGVPTSGPERGRLSRADSWGTPEPSLEDLGLFSGPTRRLSPLPPPASL